MIPGNVRLAACEPCRRAKLACDHRRPTCSRCRDRNQGEEVCVYRSRPFKRKKLHQEQQTEEAEHAEHLQQVQPTQRSPRSIHSPTLDETSTSLLIGPSRQQQEQQQQYRYPNPGFLGSSSHSTIFNHVSSRAHTNENASPHNDARQISPSYSVMDITNDHPNTAITEKGIRALSQVERLNIFRLKTLVEVWLSTDVNLPLAGPHDSGIWASKHAKILFKNTNRPILFHKDSSVAEFVSQFYNDNVRWETLGIFFAAATRATLDISFFPQLYTSEEQRHQLTTLLTSIGDSCLEACLGLDCLNDLQLVLQYENFIVHSQVYGDQSYHSWRRIGDLASSLFALGYHENVEVETSQLPNFVIQLRKAAFARIYAGDKNLAIFLGRPPRIVKAYCVFQLPDNIPGLWDIDNTITKTTEDIINYTADTRCSALFASLKEEILELFRDRDSRRQVEKASVIRSKAEEQWQILPTHFKLVTRLKDCHLRPFERDFLVGTRLDHLHTLFLLDLVLLRHISEPNDSLLKVAVEMLSLVVEAIVLRDRLVNSGTCLIWKVAHFGLPAAGIVSLALLNSSIGKDIGPLLRSKILQDLSVLVAEVGTGAVIQAGQPNFAIFTRAIRTIQSLLNILMGGDLTSRFPDSEPEIPNQYLNCNSIQAWDPWINSDPWDFEIEFWANLAEHPSLQGFEHGI
ncbi:hypothetical protein B0J14DRAFT_630429 [Halenospora varia]|nr:hypothetical protein B0J14DRAFT_630429 [Halenospora varia]